MDEAKNNRLAKLLVELAKGNGEVLGEISLLMQRILCSVGNIYYKSREDVEDSIEDIYLVLHEKAKDFRENVSACAWIVQVYRNWVKSQLRKRQVEQRYIQGEIENIKAQGNVMDEKYIENHLYLKELMSKLSDFECDLVIYYLFCECTIREVAKILHKPRATVDYHLKKLQEKLQEEQIKEKLV